MSTFYRNVRFLLFAKISKVQARKPFLGIFQARLSLFVSPLVSDLHFAKFTESIFCRMFIIVSFIWFFQANVNLYLLSVHSDIYVK